MSARLDDEELRAWVQLGVDRGWAMRSGHYAWDGTTFVPTLVLQTEAVRALHRLVGGGKTDAHE